MITLKLSRDEAIVFCEWLHRFQAEPHRFEDPAEQRVLHDLAASLESTLGERFRSDYAEILAAARARVREAMSDDIVAHER